MNNNLLEIQDLLVSFQTDVGVFKALDNISLNIKKGEILGLVGESGCGKSVTALSIMRLIPYPQGKIKSGKILFNGIDLLKLSPREMRKIRGRAISIIFQEPASSLSPLHRIGRQMVEALLFHKRMPKKQAWLIAHDRLVEVGFPDVEERMTAYPYQLSGGMQQRVMIATALMLEPDLIIADEPTTALDVTIQLQVFELIRKIRQKQTSILLITHDMGIIREMCDRVLVMYASRIVEEGSLKDVFLNPAHPYTIGLLKSIPKLVGKTGRLKTIPGRVPSPFFYPAGCNFHDRCRHATERCKKETPGFVNLNNGHRSACYIAKQLVSSIKAD